MSLSRRRFIQTSGLALCASALPLRAHASGSQVSLPIPPLLESKRGQPLFLTLQRSHWAFMSGRKVSTWGINGLYLGPTVRVYSGDDVKLIYSNRLPESVSMEISGLQVPGALSGTAHVTECGLVASAAYSPICGHAVVSRQHAWTYG